METTAPWFLRRCSHGYDARLIVAELDQMGYELTRYEAEQFWRRHSKRHGEDWRKLPSGPLAPAALASILSVEVDLQRREWYRKNPPQERVV